MFVSSHKKISLTDCLTINIPGTSFTVSVTQLATFDIDSETVLLPVTKIIKDHRTISESDRAKFDIAKRNETDFMLKYAVTPMPLTDVPDQVALQALKWVLAIKTSSEDDSATCHRALLVSTTPKSPLRHSIHGNAPTIMLSTLWMLASIFPTLVLQSKKTNNKLVMFARDVIKAFIQSLLSKRWIVNKPPPEFFKAYPQFINEVWRRFVQIYGKVEAGLYWHRTLNPWMIENISGLQQSIFDSSLMFSPTKMIEIFLCTEDTFVVIPEFMLPAEAAFEKRFECRDRQFLPTDFRGVDFIQKGDEFFLFQMTYSDTRGKAEDPPVAPTKQEPHRELNDYEPPQHRTAAGRLDWIATGTSPTCA